VLCSTSTLAHGVNLPAHLGTNGYGAECELLPRNASLYVWCVDSMPHSMYGVSTQYLTLCMVCRLNASLYVWCVDSMPHCMYGVSTLIDDSWTHSDHQRDELLERG